MRTCVGSGWTCGRTLRIKGIERRCAIRSGGQGIRERRVQSVTDRSANTRRLPSGGLMLGHRLRRWPNINPSPDWRVQFTWRSWHIGIQGRVWVCHKVVCDWGPRSAVSLLRTLGVGGGGEGGSTCLRLLLCFVAKSWQKWNEMNGVLGHLSAHIS